MPYAVHHGVGAAVGNCSPQSVSLQGLHSPWLSSSICWLYQTPDWYWRSQDPCALAFRLKPLHSKLHYHSHWTLYSILNFLHFPSIPLDSIWNYHAEWVRLKFHLSQRKWLWTCSIAAGQMGTSHWVDQSTWAIQESMNSRKYDHFTLYHATKILWNHFLTGPL